LTSVVKGIDVFVFETIENVITTGSPGDQYVGGLANGGTDIAPYHDFEEVVPQQLKDEVDQLRQDIIDGTVVPGA
jgi:basic membrane protein A